MYGQIYRITHDATEPVNGVSKNIILAHICNDKGAWGAGFVLAISEKYDEPEMAYRDWNRDWKARGIDANFRFGLGMVQLVNVEENMWVANMVAQEGVRSRNNMVPLNYAALRACLREVRRICEDIGQCIVQMPRIGCGLAGGRWEKIEPIIQAELCDRGIDVYVCDLPR